MSVKTGDTGELKSQRIRTVNNKTNTYHFHGHRQNNYIECKVVTIDCFVSLVWYLVHWCSSQLICLRMGCGDKCYSHLIVGPTQFLNSCVSQHEIYYLFCLSAMQYHTQPPYCLYSRTPKKHMFCMCMRKKRKCLFTRTSSFLIIFHLSY